MTKTKINCKHPKSGDRVIGVLDNSTKKVTLLGGIKYAFSYLRKKDTNGIGFFETRKDGKVIQKSGKFDNK